MRDETDRDGAGVAIGPRFAHLVGLGGRGMSGLAQVLAQSGMIVSGSDVAAGPELDGLRRLGIRVHEGHSPGNLPRSPHFLVFDEDKDREHPERLAALKAGSSQLTRGEFLGTLLGSKLTAAIAGGLGGGLTGAMLAWVLSCSGMDPTVVLAASSPQIGGWGRLGKGPTAVVETVDEPSEIEQLAPWLALIMTPPGASADSSSWRQLVEISASVAQGGVLVSGGFDPDDLRPTVRASVETVGLNRACDWWGADLREASGIIGSVRSTAGPS